MACKIKYKIVETFPAVRGVNVVYYTDECPEGEKLHIQFMKEKMPQSKEEVDEYILSFAPRHNLEHKARCKKEQCDFSIINTMVNQEREESSLPNIDVVEDDELIPGEFLAGKVVL